MAKTIHAFADNSGKIHTSAEEATVSDLSTVLGRLGAESGITSGVAKLILEKRAEIETIFRQHDAIAPKAKSDGTIGGAIEQMVEHAA